MKNETQYETYLREWLSGIPEEALFWRRYMRDKGGEYSKGFQEQTEKNKPFIHIEKDLEDYPKGSTIDYVDVGSGPFSRNGFISDKYLLRPVAVDPLAFIYNRLKKEYGLENGIDIVQGFVELLDHTFRKDSFDIVHMSNSLDHSFDPVTGIYELLYICKIGGKVILRHHENEAEHARYTGLHQWNLSLHNEENSFIIWNEDKRIDICKLFKDVAEIILEPDQEEITWGWKYNKVTFIKKKEVDIPQNDYYDIFVKVLFERYLDICDINNTQVEKITHEKNAAIVKQKMQEAGLSGGTVALYGAGGDGINALRNIGQNTVDLFIDRDKAGMDICGVKCISIDDAVKIPDIFVIISSHKYEKDIEKELEEHNVRHYLSIMDILGNPCMSQ